jgi:hypothetical protein
MLKEFREKVLFPINTATAGQTSNLTTESTKENPAKAIKAPAATAAGNLLSSLLIFRRMDVRV